MLTSVRPATVPRAGASSTTTCDYPTHLTILFDQFDQSLDRGFLHHDWLLEMRLRMALVDRKLVRDRCLTSV